MSGFSLCDPDDIGVAVLGAGRMGRTHLRNLGAIPNARVVVVADPDEESAARGRDLARAQRASVDPYEAIHDPAVEAVVIVTPTSTHASLIEAALRAGKAVWTEKPIAQDVGETARIVELWLETGIPVQVGFMRRFDPGYERAKALIDAGELGRIEQFRAYSRDVHPPPLEFLLTCGGSFLDMAIHDLDLARFLVGEVEEVHAWASVLFDERFAKADDWDTSLAMLKFRNGALGVVETSRHSTWGYDIRAEVAGASGKVVVDGGQKTPVTHMRRVAQEGDLYGDFWDRFEVAYRRELEAFFADLAAGRTPQPGPDDALETLRLAVACTRSWREGRPVRLDEVTAAT
ncbi:scyllo-inositol 2-dehydrogenase [soil metagenome]